MTATPPSPLHSQREASASSSVRGEPVGAVRPEVLPIDSSFLNHGVTEDDNVRIEQLKVLRYAGTLVENDVGASNQSSTVNDIATLMSSTTAVVCQGGLTVLLRMRP